MQVSGEDPKANISCFPPQKKKLGGFPQQQGTLNIWGGGGETADGEMFQNSHFPPACALEKVFPCGLSNAGPQAPMSPLPAPHLEEVKPFISTNIV